MRFFGWGLARKLKRAKHPKDRTFLLEKMPKNSVCAEIGVHLGDFSDRILKIVNPKELHLIDPWNYEKNQNYSKSVYGGKRGVNQKTMDKRYERVLKRFKSERDSKNVLVHREFSRILEKVDDDFFDWVYIDGDHRYETVKKDLELSYSKVKQGGFITGDDYVDGHWWNGGVKKAVDEIVIKENVKLVEIKNTQFILKKT